MAESFTFCSSQAKNGRNSQKTTLFVKEYLFQKFLILYPEEFWLNTGLGCVLMCMSEWLRKSPSSHRSYQKNLLSLSKTQPLPRYVLHVIFSSFGNCCYNISIYLFWSSGTPTWLTLSCDSIMFLSFPHSSYQSAL